MFIDSTTDIEFMICSYQIRKRKMLWKKSYNWKCIQKCNFVFPSISAFLFFADTLWNGRFVYYWAI